jgi:NodT family efflux transporter outer membrane factor (OMF) lipoprotein
VKHMVAIIRQCRERNLESGVVILGCIALLLSGCFKVGPEFARPPASASPTWLDANDPRVRTEATDYRNWWQAFNDPTLNGLIERAYRENLSLRSAGVRVLQARAQLGIAAGELYPQTQQATGSLQYNRLSGSSPLAAFSRNPEYWQSQLGGQASWELDFWGKFRRGIESADASLLATLADYDNTLVTLTAEVANSYITIRTAQERIHIARENVKTQQENLKIAEARFQNGTATQLDVEQARTSLLNTQASIPPLETQLCQARDALSVLLGLPPSDLRELLGGPSGIPVSPPQVIVGIPADLLRRRPDVRKAERQAAAQSAQIGVAESAFYPHISIDGTIDYQADRFQNLFNVRALSGSVGPSFRWDILQYGRLLNNVRAQEAQFYQLVEAYEQTVLNANQEVENGLVTFLRAQERYQLQKKSVDAGQAALDTVRAQWRAGVVDFTRVAQLLQTQVVLEDTLAQVQGEIATGLISVYQGLGGGWQIRLTGCTSGTAPTAGAEVLPAPRKLEGGAEKQAPKRAALGTPVAE